jgi:hypothetical protein
MCSSFLPVRAAIGDNLAILPHRPTVTDVSVMHPGADAYVHRSFHCSSAAKTRDAQKFAKYNVTGSAVYRTTPFSHKSNGRSGQAASEF